jgi:hypothetical protein
LVVGRFINIARASSYFFDSVSDVPGTMPPGPSPAFDANNAGMSTYGPAFGASSPVLNKGVDAAGRARRPKRKKPLDPTAAVMLQMEGAPFWTTWRDQPVIQVTSTHAQGHSLDGWKVMPRLCEAWGRVHVVDSIPLPLLPSSPPSHPPSFPPSCFRLSPFHDSRTPPTSST